MAFEVIFSELAEKQADTFVNYLIHIKKNPQAAINLLEDFDDTKEALALVADSLGYCRDPELKAMGYRIMHFRHHRYLWIYQVHNDRVEVKAMYHELQDYENIFAGESVERPQSQS